jgi:hypothetical protein
MAGYSSTPLPKKLGIKDGSRLLLVGAPDDFEKTLGTPPNFVTVVQDPKGKPKSPFDVIVLFARAAKDLDRRFDAAVACLDPSGGLWVAWPKKASGVATDVTEHLIRDTALARGLVDNKVCAIDEVWSGLRVVVRVENRPKKKSR